MSQTLLINQVLNDLEMRDARLRALLEMTPVQRVVAMRRGTLTLERCAAWAGRYPDQVPLLYGEFEYLPRRTSEVCG
jgi:hypothetical protein